MLNNIKFYNNNITNEQIENIAKLLGLDKDLELKSGLTGVIEDGKFTSL